MVSADAALARVRGVMGAAGLTFDNPLGIELIDRVHRGEITSEDAIRLALDAFRRESSHRDVLLVD